MRDAEDGSGGWTFLRVVGFVVGLLVMAGFGFCSLCGLAIGAGADLELLFTLILPGFVIAGLGFWLARRMRPGRTRNDRADKPWRH
jgi:hypothetical protein